MSTAYHPQRPGISRISGLYFTRDDSLAVETAYVLKKTIERGRQAVVGVENIEIQIWMSEKQVLFCFTLRLVHNGIQHCNPAISSKSRSSNFRSFYHLFTALVIFLVTLCIAATFYTYICHCLK